MSGTAITVAGLAWSPLLPWPVLAGLGTVAAGLVSWGLLRRARGSLWRAAALAVLLGVLANPEIVRETRTSLDDVAFVMVDDSASQNLGQRPTHTAEALTAVRDRLESLDGLEVRVVHVADGNPNDAPGTRLFEALEHASAEVPPDRVAGTVLITDGQVHDVPATPPRAFPAPVHALLTGRRQDSDRRLEVENAPAFGLVGKDVTLRLTVTDTALPQGAEVPVTLTLGDGPPRRLTAANDQPRTISVTLDHAGPNVVELSTDPRPGELTPRNNRTALTINGVRDRMRVLLISGTPNVGERAWRRLLKADPNVDLVHFTILRPPTKDDGTPLSDLALISFPIRELFEEKLAEFDLIIFDRYSRQGLVPFGFLENIADFVRHGGAILQAVGPEYAGPYSLFDSPLGAVLPAEPTGRIVARAYHPHLSALGQRHPVTAGLDTDDRDTGRVGTPWGPWMRQVEGIQRRGEVLMTGPGDAPLLVLDHVEDGRVALLLSDTIWLWARGYQGGGPQQELVRRTAHWLMREPDLEEEALTAQVDAGRLEIERRTLADLSSRPEPLHATVTAPDGHETQVPLTPEAPGRARATLAADQPGVWRMRQGTLSAVAAAGAPDPLEMRDVVATSARLAPVAEATGGTVRWLEDGLPRFERVRGDRVAHGAGWLGLRANGAHVVNGVRQTTLLPPLLALVLALGALMVAWWREGR